MAPDRAAYGGPAEVSFWLRRVRIFDHYEMILDAGNDPDTTAAFLADLDMNVEYPH